MPHKSSKPGFRIVPGSERPKYTRGQVAGPCDGNETVRATVMVRRKNAREFEHLVRRFEQRSLSDSVQPLTAEEFAERFGADPADLQAVTDFAAQNGLGIEETDAARRIVILSGTVEQMNGAFGVALQRCEEGGRTFRVREGSISVPESIGGIVTGVFGLDERPQAKPHFRIQPAATKAVAYSPIQIASLYQFPSNTTGVGETIGIIELGGGFETSDLDTFFKGLGITTSPQVTAVSVDGAQNVPGGRSKRRRR